MDQQIETDEDSMIYTVSLTNNGQYLAIGNSMGKVYLFESTNGGTFTQKMEAGDAMSNAGVMSVDIADVAMILVSSSEDVKIKVY